MCLLVLLSVSRVVWAVLVRCLPRSLPCLLLFSWCFFVGAVPKTGNDILGIPLPRPRLRARSNLGYMAIAYGAASPLIIIDLSLLSTLRRLVSRAVAAVVSAVSASLSFGLHIVETTLHHSLERVLGFRGSVQRQSVGHYRFAQRQVHIQVCLVRTESRHDV